MSTGRDAVTAVPNLTTRTVTEYGVELPYTRTTYWWEEGEHVKSSESGTAFVPLDLLDALVETACIVEDDRVEAALLTNGLAVEETRGSLHRSEALPAFVDELRKQYADRDKR